MLLTTFSCLASASCARGGGGKGRGRDHRVHRGQQEHRQRQEATEEGAPKAAEVRSRILMGRKVSRSQMELDNVKRYVYVPTLC